MSGPSSNSHLCGRRLGLALLVGALVAWSLPLGNFGEITTWERPIDGGFEVVVRSRIERGLELRVVPSCECIALSTSSLTLGGNGTASMRGRYVSLPRSNVRPALFVLSAATSEVVAIHRIELDAQSTGIATASSHR